MAPGSPRILGGCRMARLNFHRMTAGRSLGLAILIIAKSRDSRHETCEHFRICSSGLIINGAERSLGLGHSRRNLGAERTTLVPMHVIP